MIHTCQAIKYWPTNVHKIFNTRIAVLQFYTTKAAYWPRFFFLAISFSTSLLAMAMTFEDKELHKGPLGSGRPSRGLKYRHIDIVEQPKHSCSRSALAHKTERQPYNILCNTAAASVLIIHCRKYFVCYII